MNRLTIKRLSLLTLVGLALAGNSFASIPLVVNQTYNSGYSGSTALPGGSIDNYFNLYSYAGSQPVVASQDNPAWVQVVGAQWIAPIANQSASGGSPNGVYDYNALLATDFLVPTSITVTGSYAADDGSTVYINGVQVSTVAPEGDTSLTSFSYTFTLNQGPTFVPIDFLVNNLNTGGSSANNSTGLLVSTLKFTTGNTAPEPATWAMMFAGLALVLMVRKSRAGVL